MGKRSSTPAQGPNRVWIELERPKDDHEGDKRAAQATLIMRAFGDAITTFWWNKRQGVYCLTIDTGGSYLELGDRGHWFNLDRIADHLTRTLPREAYARPDLEPEPARMPQDAFGLAPFKAE
jgi:hypothetical protein